MNHLLRKRTSTMSRVAVTRPFTSNSASPSNASRGVERPLRAGVPGSRHPRRQAASHRHHLPFCFTTHATRPVTATTARIGSQIPPCPPIQP